MDWAESLKSKGATEAEIAEVARRCRRFEDPANLSPERAETMLEALRRDKSVGTGPGRVFTIIVLLFFVLAILVAAGLLIAESR